MSKFVRMIDVLDLYSESVTLLTAEDVAARLQVSRPTAFRYMRELNTAGFLANYAGRYSLGARIITLDYRIRASDPVLKEAQELMRAMSAETSCGSILCRMYNDEIINVHDEAAYDAPALSFFGRGRPLPLFRGSASKVMLAHMPRARLRKLYQRHAAEPDVQRIGSDWAAFLSYFTAIRKTGHYVSNQEVDAGTVGIAAPILLGKTEAIGSVSLVFSVQRLSLLNCDGVAVMLKDRLQQLSHRLHRAMAASQVLSGAEA